MLDIYKASAGSGKTFRLTLEYIKLLLGKRDEHGVYRFYKNYHNVHRHILAVTFTNKATDEMKQRILHELDILTHHIEASRYREELCRIFACSESLLQEKSQQILLQILHDFSYFNVSTIDSFFQQVLRAFAREQGLQAGFDVEIDEKAVTTIAIDRLFADLEHDEKMLDWLLHLADEVIRNGRSWDITGKINEKADIKELARMLFLDVYKEYRSEIVNKSIDDFHAYIDLLEKNALEYRNQLKAYSLEALNVLDKYGLIVDLFYRAWPKVLVTQFSKVDVPLKSYSTFLDRCTDPDKWFAKKNAVAYADILPSFTSDFLPIMQKIFSLLGEPLKEYLSVSHCLKNIYAFGVLSAIDRNISLYEQEQNMLIISKTSKILNAIINDSDAPFIYEKVGTRIDHYMIDEFQDTSKIQWLNFEPLVNDSLSSGNDNLIVGDVKQSIYRFRDSDWRLLHQGFDSEQNKAYKHHDLDVNWRSESNIVMFNNLFFAEAARVMQNKLKSNKVNNDTILSVFEHVAQSLPQRDGHEGGHVEVAFVETEQAGAKAFMEHADKYLQQQLCTLLDKGYTPSDIVILVRFNKQAQHIVELLLSLSVEATSSLHNINVVSEEALVISSAPPIKLILGILHYIKDPEMPINELLLNYEYELLLHGNTQGKGYALASYFENRRNGVRLNEDLQTFIKKIETLSLYEMCEQIIAFFLDKDKSGVYIVYLEAFQDVVQEYCAKHTADIHSFLLWWNEVGCRKTVKSPEKLNAIRVLTIHKSKGLEFPAVIIPYANWVIDHNNSIWLKPDRYPFNQMPVLPITMVKELSQTIFDKQYNEELTNVYIDNLNLLYVAFTRAQKELIICVPKNRSQSQYKVDRVICEVADDGSLFSNLMQSSENVDGVKVYELGNNWCPSFSANTANDMLHISYRVTTPDNRMRLRLKSSLYPSGQMLEYGTLMHEMLADMRYVTDVYKVVQSYVESGKLKCEQRQETIEQFNDWLSHPDVQHWFSPDVKVLSETTILQPGATIYRPDRVVIDKSNDVTIVDYKFGRIKAGKRYRKQVLNYIDMVRRMGLYNNVDGYIWYLTLGEIEKV